MLLSHLTQAWDRMTPAQRHWHDCVAALMDADARSLHQLLEQDPQHAQRLLRFLYAVTTLPLRSEHTEACVRVLRAAGAQPWLVDDYDAPVVAIAAAMHARTGLDVGLPALLDTPREREEAELMGLAVARGTTRLPQVGARARARRMPNVFRALLTQYLPDTHGFDTNELEGRIRAYAPSREEARDALPLLFRLRMGEETLLTAITRSNAAWGLLCAGAMPFATPPAMEPRWGARSPVLDVLDSAVADLHARRLALAMARHRRLGGGSLLALLNDDVFLCIARDVTAADVARSPRAHYAMQLATTLHTRMSVRIFTQPSMVTSLFQECVRDGVDPSDALLRHFRTLWRAQHLQ